MEVAPPSVKQSAGKAGPPAGARAIPADLIYPGAFYFVSQLGQRIPFGAFTSLTVFLFDHGYAENSVALFKLTTGLPYVLKIIPAFFADRPAPPWTGSAFWLAGRWRPIILVSSSLAVVFVIVFSFVNGVDPESGSTPGLGSICALAFAVIMGVSTADQAIDAHTTELVSPYRPDYVAAGESYVRWAGRVVTTKSMGTLAGFAIGILLVTQLGPSWSYMGAFALLAVPMLPTAAMVWWLPDARGPPPELPADVWEEGKVTCKQFLDRMLARGPDASMFRTVRIVCACNFMVYFMVGGLETLSVSQLKNLYDIPAQEEGYVKVCAITGLSVGATVGGQLADRVRPPLVVLAASLLLLPCVPLTWAAAEYSGTSATAVAIGFCAVGLGAAGEALIVLMIYNTPPASPAFSFALANLPANIGIGLSSLLLVIAGSSSYAVAYGILTLAVIAMLLMAAFRLRLDPNTQVQEIRRRASSRISTCSCTGQAGSFKDTVAEEPADTKQVPRRQDDETSASMDVGPAAPHVSGDNRP